jgi:hypothetical protein
MKTTRQWVGLLIAAALFGAGAASASAAEKVTTITKTKVTKLTKTGWWIRVNPEKTHATTVSLRVGTSKKDSRDWRSWTAGQPMEFDLPAELRNVPKLYIHGATVPGNKHVVFCVFYMDHGVEHFAFDGDVDKNMEATDSDRDCKP